MSASALPVDGVELAIRGDRYNPGCAARQVLGHVTGRWGGLVLGALLTGTQRYSALRTRIEGISEKMLAQTLRELERDGLIARRQYPEMPPRVEYSLTPAGEEIARHLDTLMRWLEDHVSDLIAAHRCYEQTHPSSAAAR